MEYPFRAIDEIDSDPLEGPDGIIMVDFGSSLLSGDFCCIDGETMKLIAVKEKALKKDPEYLRTLYHRQVWFGSVWVIFNAHMFTHSYPTLIH